MRVIQKALTFDEERRPQTIGDWRAALTGQAAARTMVVKEPAAS